MKAVAQLLVFGLFGATMSQLLSSTAFDFATSAITQGDNLVPAAASEYREASMVLTLSQNWAPQQPVKVMYTMELDARPAATPDTFQEITASLADLGVAANDLLAGKAKPNVAADDEAPQPYYAASAESHRPNVAVVPLNGTLLSVHRTTDGNQGGLAPLTESDMLPVWPNEELSGSASEPLSDQLAWGGANESVTEEDLMLAEQQPVSNDNGADGLFYASFAQDFEQPVAEPQPTTEIISVASVPTHEIDVANLFDDLSTAGQASPAGATSADFGTNDMEQESIMNMQNLLDANSNFGIQEDTTKSSSDADVMGDIGMSVYGCWRSLISSVKASWCKCQNPCQNMTTAQCEQTAEGRRFQTACTFRQDCDEDFDNAFKCYNDSSATYNDVTCPTMEKVVSNSERCLDGEGRSWAEGGGRCVEGMAQEAVVCTNGQWHGVSFPSKTVSCQSLGTLMGAGTRGCPHFQAVSFS